MSEITTEAHEQGILYDAIRRQAIALAGKWINMSVDMNLIPSRWKECDLLTQLIRDKQQGILNIKLGVEVPINELVAIIALSRSTGLDETHGFSIATALFGPSRSGLKVVKDSLEDPATRSIGIAQIYEASMDPKYPQDNFLRIGRDTKFEFKVKDNIQTPNGLQAIAQSYSALNERPLTDFKVLYAEENPWSWNTK